ADADLESLGWSVGEARGVLKALGYTPVKRPAEGEPTIWRQRQPRLPPPTPPAVAPAPVDSTSPFAALSALTPAPKAERRPRRRPRKPRPPGVAA
ncbi:MAG: helicase-related protein, partial [Caulobacteraceae bacterium]